MVNLHLADKPELLTQKLILATCQSFQIHTI